ncbi:SDR family NAD(P)-dependent oxidoreductase [Leifsonia shinshuensis]|uniref:SDR family NAD(P)-dependent oxidoreductase n=1 Tax=Leifsonia shinshuensis TaxID=150026 RepID=UPI00285B5044|nr:SDR family NAD(P)-dependent oxidoreductase [Leifsonia shinshuensis]MDR6972603.1 NAD(P)-dependent dehydrogenase (short-subunit alcohol dehydrogenase family) [Leifsonia shinshuensis]
MSASPVVVITGASSGLGRATALAFARRHARLVLVARGAAGLEDVVAEARAHGARDAVAVGGDTTDPATGDRAADTAIARYGRLHLWVNAAAVSSYARFWEQPAAEFERVLDVDIRGYANGVRSALGVMRSQRSGVIVNVASILGEVPQPYSAAYSMSKAAVIAFGRSLRSELALAKSPVHVVTVLPPALDTPIFQHAGNRSGREVRALPPVYPPSRAVDEILAAWKHPARGERTVTAAGRTLVRQHTKRPATVEAAIARQTELGQFRSKPSGPTTGNLFSPSGEPLSVSGGWGGRRAQTRRLLTGAALIAGAVAVVRAVRTQRD